MLISNRLTYTLVFSDEEFESDTDCNDAIFRLLELWDALVQRLS